MTPLRFALIGYGAWGKFHAASIVKAPSAQLAAIACGGSASAEAARRDHPGARVTEDWRELVAAADIDAVAISTPNHLHAEATLAALAADKHVLLEKPMATTIADCDRLVAAARRSKGVLTIGHEMRRSPQWVRIKEALDAGAIGAPRHAHVGLFRHPYRHGAEGWRYDPTRVGSWILEEPIHFFDLLLWYFERLGPPRAVLAHGNGLAGGARMTDNVSTTLRFAGDAYATVNQTLAGFGHHLTVELVGSEGAVRALWSAASARSTAPSVELWIKARGEAEARQLPVERSGEVFELEDQAAAAVAAFRAGKPLVSAEEGRRAVVVCLEAERSLAEDREIALAW